MELPEQDRQAFIDAARRRTQPQEGGAAFGVYPSSGKRPEKLNVSRDVNMPAQVARGWVAGTLGLPGDIEGLGRLLVNMAPAGQEHERVTGKSFVGETPVLPTSDFYREWLPGGDERPAAQFASGLGALAGGAGSTKVAGAAVKGAKATGKALGPKAAEMAEGYLQKSGLAPSVVKPKGGNWLSGSVETATNPLVKRGFTPEQVAEHEARPRPIMSARDLMLQPEDIAINNWVDKKLNRYIKNEMATPEDPVRKLAERGVTHLPEGNLERAAEWTPDTLGARRKAAGFPEEGYATTPAGQGWEQLADEAIHNMPASERIKQRPAGYQDPDTWLDKVPPETMTYGAYKGIAEGDELGLQHLIDELRNATSANSDLPANLRWKPEDLKKVTMEQAVERVAKINEYRAAMKAEADELLARNPATFQFKDYEVVPGTQEPNSKGLSWKQIQPPNLEMPEGIRRVQQSATQGGIDVPGIGVIPAKWDPKTGLDWAGAERDAKKLLGKKPLQEALDYEADVMGHCVRGYCNDVLQGKKQIYSLRDKKGEPHVTIEVAPIAIRTWDDVTSAVGKTEAAKLYDEFNNLSGYNTSNAGDVFDEFIKQKNITPPQRIVQIKGKSNAAPKAEYLPFVQDFVRSGQWSSVGDIQNTGMRATSSVFNDAELQRLRDAGETNIPHILSGEDIQRLHNLITPEGRRLKYDAKGNIVGSEEPGYAKGGLVQDTDAIVAQLKGMDKDKALTQALRMANAKQEAHMAAGGLSTLFKGGAKAAKAAEEAAKAAKAAKVAKPVEKAAEAAKPATRVVSEPEALKKAKKAGYPMAPKDRWYGEGTYDKSGGRLEMISPDEFLRKVRPLEIDDASRDNIDYLKRHIQSGGELDPLLITKSGKEDGRHRAHAAKELGIAEVPVIRYDRDIPAAPQAKALETARKNAVKMLGLPENNTAMDRARAMGFDTPAAHFSRHGVDVHELDSAKFAIAPFDAVGTHVGSEAAALDRYQNTMGYKVGNPNYANDELKGVTYPVLIKNQRPMLNEKGQPFAETPLSTQFSETADYGNLRDSNAALRKDIFSRYDTIPYVNDVEAAGQVSYIVPPKNIRSRFAAFDPANVNESDLLGAADPALLAGTAVASGIGLGALRQIDKRKPEQEEKKKAAGGLAKRM